jgi:quercetin dioxygenase-like cupin family protein
MSEQPSDAIGTRLLFENDRVRVWEQLLQPGETFPQHRHPYDYVQIVAQGSRASATIDEQTRAWMIENNPELAESLGDRDYVEVDLAPGQVLWSTGGSVHDTGNVGDTPMHIFLVELKS